MTFQAQKGQRPMQIKCIGEKKKKKKNQWRGDRTIDT